MTVVEPVNVGSLMSDADGVERDLRLIRGYVKDDLFYKVIFVFNQKVLEEGEKLHEDFIKNCTSMVANGRLANTVPAESNPYLKFLWYKMLNDKSYKEWVAIKRSNAYQAVQDKFYCKCTKTMWITQESPCNH
jgi:hypothetical protein